MKFWQIILSSLSNSNEVSEKRMTRMAIVVILLICTIAEFIKHDFTMPREIFWGWLGFAGYDGYRITQEKKQAQDASTRQATIKATGEAIKDITTKQD